MPILILLLVGAVVEISVLVLVGQLIGVLPTIGLLVGGALLGSWLLRREGRRTLSEFGEAARLRRPPDREISDGVLVAAGGVLILVPGLVSDLVGLVVLLPPVRGVLRERLRRSAERQSQRMQQRMQEQMRTFGAPGGFGPPGADPRGFGERGFTSSDDVIDGEVVSVDEEDTSAGPSSGQELPRRSHESGEDRGQRGEST